jgi:hypothetical protein
MVRDRRRDGHALTSVHHFLGHHEGLRLGVKSDWNIHCLYYRALVSGKRFFHRTRFHPRRIGSLQRMEIGIAKLSWRRLENINRVAGIEFDPFQRQAILVVYREDFFLAIDRRTAFDIEGMDGDKAHLMLALDPANRFKMMSLDTYTPDIVMPPVNPAPGVTYGPAPGDGVPGEPGIDHPGPAGNRIPLHLVTNGGGKTRREGAPIRQIEGCRRPRWH